MVTDRTAGEVYRVPDDVNASRYCTYRAVLLIEAPDVIVANADHVPSGVAVSPVRTLTTSVVPVGTVESQARLSHPTWAPASNTCDTKVPLLPYGPTRAQSTASPPSVVTVSAKDGRRFENRNDIERVNFATLST